MLLLSVSQDVWIVLCAIQKVAWKVLERRGHRNARQSEPGASGGGGSTCFLFHALFSAF